MASSGLILSPYYPGFYAPNSSCNWLITAPVGHVIRLEVLDFQLERDPRCATDHLEVTDGNTVGEKNLGRYCGDEIPKLMQSTRNTLHIAFRSDMSVQRTGFKIHYSFKGLSQQFIILWLLLTQCLFQFRPFLAHYAYY